MEITGTNRKYDRRRIKKNRRSNGFFIGVVFILAGMLLVGRNTGAIDYHTYNILMSWQMIVILIGIILFSRRDYTAGTLLTTLGIFFLLPRLAGPGWPDIYKPLFLILAGLLIILKVSRPTPKRMKHEYGNSTHHASGFVEADEVLGNYKNIVLDETFTGANIRATLSGTVLDLRHTALAEGETYVDLQCVLSGVEIYVPADWEVLSEVRIYLGGVSKTNGMAGDRSTYRAVNSSCAAR